MYNLPLPKLRATLLADPLSLEFVPEWAPNRECTANALCTVLYGGLNSELV